MKDKLYGFWLGCPCDIGGRLFVIEEDFYYGGGEFVLTEKEIREELEKADELRLPDTCSFCHGANDYVIFRESKIEEVLKNYPWLKRRAANYNFLKEKNLI